IATIPVSGAKQVAVNPTLNRIYAATEDDFLRIIDGLTNTVIASVALPLTTSLHYVAVNSSTNRVYVTNADANSLTVVDGVSGSVVTTLTLASIAAGVAVNPATNRIYVASPVGLVIVDGVTNTEITTVPVDFGIVSASPNQVAVNPALNRIYVT